MERELEKDLKEIEYLIYVHKERENTHTQSVLERAHEIIEPCAKAAKTLPELEELLSVVGIIRKHMNDGWISVEDRLPEVDEDTEDTIEDNDCPEYIVTIRGTSESTTLKYRPDGTWFDENGYVYDVIAWRPLPEPYHPERRI